MEKKIGGIYVLFISVRRSILLKVGALGKIELSKGIYAYVGSAQNGIKMRVASHLFKIEEPALFEIMGSVESLSSIKDRQQGNFSNSGLDSAKEFFT